MAKNNPDLSKVLTLSEAAQRWKLSNGASIRKAIERKKFNSHEIRKSGGVWLIAYSAMKRVFGPEPGE